jgi:hypothetical protein
MAQQTAVDWLIEQINGYAYPLPFDRNIRIDISKEIIDQAKEMEEEQIINARENGKWEITKCINDPNYTFSTSEQYYNETFGK